MRRLAVTKQNGKRVTIYDIEKAKQYAWEQAAWIAHSNGYFLMKECVFFYHKGNVVFDPWNDKEQYGILPLLCAWSRISDYQDYLEYEEKLIEVIDELPLDWEFAKWVESAHKQKVEKRKAAIVQPLGV